MLWWGLVIAVLLAHLFVQQQVADDLAQIDARHPAMERMQAVYTRQIAPEAPPAAPEPPPQTAPARETAPRVAKAASSPVRAASAAQGDQTDEVRVAAVAASAVPPAASAVAEAGSVAASAPVSVVQMASAPASAPSLVAAAGAAPVVAVAASAASGSAAATSASAVTRGSELIHGVRWPASTRLNYQIEGWYRGAIQGNAQVEWLRQGTRYQVHLDVSLGAGVLRRRMSSEGRITPQGLAPLRYEEETRPLIGQVRRRDMAFEGDEVRLADGHRVPALPALQDTASQFVHLIFLLTTQPALRQAGAVVEFNLALPNRADRWVYDIGPTEQLYLPVGAVDAFHVRPRRPAASGELSVQMWMAPNLQMMPVRIRIEQDTETWIDLRLQEMPVQAGP